MNRSINKLRTRLVTFAQSFSEYRTPQGKRQIDAWPWWLEEEISRASMLADPSPLLIRHRAECSAPSREIGDYPLPMTVRPNGENSKANNTGPDQPGCLIPQPGRFLEEINEEDHRRHGDGKDPKPVQAECYFEA